LPLASQCESRDKKPIILKKGRCGQSRSRDESADELKCFSETYKSFFYSTNIERSDICKFKQFMHSKISIDDDRENVKPIAIIVATVAIIAIAAVAQLDLD
jgi:hypothetical protein